MAHRNKNMLEAFQASAAAEKAHKPPPPRAGGPAPKAGGPFAAERPVAAPAPAPRPAAAPAAGSAAGAWRPTQMHRLVVLQVLLMLAAFLLGRASVSPVAAAAAPEQESAAAGKSPARGQPPEAAAASLAPPSSPTAPPAAVADTSARSAAEKALLDRANTYTIKLVEYTRNRDEALAFATRDHLLSKDLPVALVEYGRRLYILLGAAPRQADLDALLKRAQTMPGPPPLNKPAEFHDAYLVQIDRVFPRGS